MDFYIGGIEHATMHLIYSRFFTKVLRDLGLVPFGEPVKRLICQGMVIKDGAKMSKSLGNIVDPDEMIERYGADAVRLNILFVSPPWDQLDWKDSGAEGSFRFLNRVYALVEDLAEDLKGPVEEPTGEVSPLRRKTHQTVARVTAELDERLKINTAIAGLMELVNAMTAYVGGYGKTPAERFVLREAAEALVAMLSPFSPHVADALWEMLGPEGFPRGRPMAHLRPGHRERRRDHHGGPGQRKGPRADHGTRRRPPRGGIGRGQSQREGRSRTSRANSSSKNSSSPARSSRWW